MPHPSYPNPTIVEAVSEIHFSLAPGLSWSPSTPGALWREIATEYPDVDPIVESGVEVRVKPDGSLDHVITERKRYRFTHTSKSKLVQLSENVFSLNHLKPYPGWPTVKDELIRVWRQFTKIVEPSGVTRIGLRYVNAIQRDGQDELASRWLQETPFLPRQPLQSLPPFSSRVEARLEKTNRAIVSMGIGKKDVQFGYIVFDIDCIREENIDATAESISDAAEDLHEHAWAIFRAAKTDDLERMLKQTP